MRIRVLTAILAVALGSSILPASAAGQKLTLDEVIAKHLASIGTPEVRAAAKTRVAEGTLKYEILSGGAGTMEGKAVLVSQGNNIREVLRFNRSDYRGEDLLTDSSRIQIFKGLILSGRSTPDRSLLGEFLYNEPSVLRDGIFGGAIATSWPLLSAKYRDAKLTYNGLKKVDGRELHEVQYVPKKKGDVQIRLYFDQDFRHVMTVATVEIHPSLLSGGSDGLAGNFMGRDDPQTGGVDTANARQQPIRFRMEQTFSGFRQVDGLTLPSECGIKFSAEGYRSQVANYTVHFDTIENNVPLDPKNFAMK